MRSSKDLSVSQRSRSDAAPESLLFLRAGRIRPCSPPHPTPLSCLAAFKVPAAPPNPGGELCFCRTSAGEPCRGSADLRSRSLTAAPRGRSSSSRIEPPRLDAPAPPGSPRARSSPRAFSCRRCSESAAAARAPEHADRCFPPLGAWPRAHTQMRVFTTLSNRPASA